MAIYYSILFWEKEGVVVMISLHTLSFSGKREEVRVTMARYPVPLLTKGRGKAYPHTFLPLVRAKEGPPIWREGSLIHIEP